MPPGYNSGHGQQPLDNFLLALNLLAFFLHTLLDLLDDQYQLLRKHLIIRKVQWTQKPEPSDAFHAD